MRMVYVEVNKMDDMGAWNMFIVKGKAQVMTILQ